VADQIQTQTSEEKQVATSAAPPVNLEKDYVPIADFRKFQGVKDKEVAQVRAESAAQAAELEKMRDQMAQVISDPAARAKFQSQRQEAELQKYRAKDAVNEQRRQLAATWGIPEDVLGDTNNAAEMTKNALDWQKEQLEATMVTAEQAAKEKEVQRTENEGGHKVSLAPGAPPQAAAASDTEIDKEISDLRTVAHGGGSAGSAARMQILELERQRQRGRVPRARV